MKIKKLFSKKKKNSVRLIFKLMKYNQKCKPISLKDGQKKWKICQFLHWETRLKEWFKLKDSPRILSEVKYYLQILIWSKFIMTQIILQICLRQPIAVIINYFTKLDKLLFLMLKLILMELISFLADSKLLRLLKKVILGLLLVKLKASSIKLCQKLILSGRIMVLIIKQLKSFWTKLII